jgi:hypothetical protein
MTFASAIYLTGVDRMIYEGAHDCPEIIDCSEVVKHGGRVKGGIIHEKELLMDYYHYGKSPSAPHSEHGKHGTPSDIEIRVSIRSSKLPSIELFTLRNVKPADYRLVLVAIPRDSDPSTGK